MNNDKPIAVIILNWNGETLLQEFLPKVIATTDDDIADIIVVDNGSSDNSVALLDQEFPKVQLIKFSENYGFAEGYNRAIELTQYKYTVLLNSDVATADGWLVPLYDYMEQHPEVGACQPKLLSYKEPEMFEYAGASGGFIDKNGYPYCRGRLFATVEKDNHQYDDVISVFWATGAALMVRSSLYLSVGGLDKDFFAHMEEIDLCWRLQLLGKRVVAVTDSVVYHLGGGTLAAGNPRKTYLNFRNNLFMLYKNLPLKEGKKLIFKRKLLDGLAAILFLVKLSFGEVKSVWLAHRHFERDKHRYKNQPSINMLKHFYLN